MKRHALFVGVDEYADPTIQNLAYPAEDAIELGDEYLPMGDNTFSSFDGRYWGPVPRTQMLGPAACVYWPLSVRWGLGAVR